MTQETPNPMPPIKIAFVLDGEVADILHTDERLAAIFLSNPLIIDVTNKFTEHNSVLIGAKYNADTKTFTNEDGTNV
jgi:hypothetical protein